MTRLATLTARLLGALCMLTVALAWVLRLRHRIDRWIELARYPPYPAFLALALLGVLLAPGPRAGAAWRRWPCCRSCWFRSWICTMSRRGVGRAPLRLMSFNVKAYGPTASPDGFGRLAWEIALHERTSSPCRTPTSPTQRSRFPIRSRRRWASGAAPVRPVHHRQPLPDARLPRRRHLLPGEGHHLRDLHDRRPWRRVRPRHRAPAFAARRPNATRHERLGGLAELARELPRCG